jgi:hypothetical protein
MEPRVWSRYGVATLAVVIAAVLREAMFHIHPLEGAGQRSPLSFMYPAVMFATLYCGTGPGVLAAALAFVVATIHVSWQGSAFIVRADADFTRLTLFLAVNAMIVLIGSRAHRAR